MLDNNNHEHRQKMKDFMQDPLFTPCASSCCDFKTFLNACNGTDSYMMAVQSANFKRICGIASLHVCHSAGHGQPAMHVMLTLGLLIA